MLEERTKFDAIRAYIRNVAAASERDDKVSLLSRFGAINVRSRQRITNVPFLLPTLVLVISGQKSLYVGSREESCSSGDYLAIPAPSSFDVVNVPINSHTPFLALYLQFDIELVQRFRQFYSNVGMPESNQYLKIQGSELLDSVVYHYLELLQGNEPQAEIAEHRMLEILLCLVNYCNAGHMLLSMSEKWSEQVYSLIISNPSASWRFRNVCELLNLSESTLRRYLRKENNSFQKILDEVRMGQAIYEVQFTNWPISRIAENSGFSSFSQFTTRFRERFDSTPTQMRKEMAGFG